MASQALLLTVLLACAVGCFCRNFGDGYGDGRGPCWPISTNNPRVHESMKEAARQNGHVVFHKIRACVYGPYGPFNRYTDYYVHYSVSWEKECEFIVVWDAMSFTGGIINVYGRGCYYV